MLIVVKVKIMMALSCSSNWNLLATYSVPSILLSIKCILCLISHNQPNSWNPPLYLVLRPAKSCKNKLLQFFCRIWVLKYCAQIKSFLNSECGMCGFKQAIKRQVSLEIKHKRRSLILNRLNLEPFGSD